MKALTPASEERNSTVDVISGVLETGEAELCSLQVYKFLITPLEVPSWKFSVRSKAPLGNLAGSSFLVALQTV